MISLLLDSWSVQVLIRVTTEDSLAGSGDVSENNLTSLSLTSTRVTSDNDRLIFLVKDQLLEGVFRNHEKMRTRILLWTNKRISEW